MRQKCVFNPVCDIDQVSPNGALDLAQAYALGSVPANLTSESIDFDGTEDPSSIIGKPDDVFSAMQASKVIEERAKSRKESE